MIKRGRYRTKCTDPLDKKSHFLRFALPQRPQAWSNTNKLYTKRKIILCRMQILKNNLHILELTPQQQAFYPQALWKIDFFTNFLALKSSLSSNKNKLGYVWELLYIQLYTGILDIKVFCLVLSLRGRYRTNYTDPFHKKCIFLRFWRLYRPQVCKKPNISYTKGKKIL